MSDKILHLYQALPYLLRCAMASARGLYLRRWRYGPETDRLVQEAFERESWDQDQWNRWQQERLKSVLHRALTKVPYYREFWSKQQHSATKLAWEDLRNWPVLQKETLRSNPKAFLADDANTGEMFHQRTSGTSGKPLDLWLSREAVQNLYALFEGRVRLWNGVSREHRVATLGGQLVAPVHRRKPPFWVWNAALKQLYMSSYHLAPDLIPAYLDALKRHRIEYIFGYVSSLHALAQEIIKSGRSDLVMKVAMTNAEPLHPHQAETISKAFQCPVRETYGNGESLAAASGCTGGKLHLWPELGIVEVLNGNERLPEGTTGDLVYTGIANPMMPLIRYRIGDRGRVGATTMCACGRTLPTLDSFEGRLNDILLTRDGRKVFWINPVFYGLPLVEAQVVQKSLEEVCIRYVPGSSFTGRTKDLITSRLCERLGDVRIRFEEVLEIPRGPNGKFRTVVCEISTPDAEVAHSRAECSGAAVIRTTPKGPKAQQTWGISNGSR